MMIHFISTYKIITFRWNFEKFLLDYNGQPMRRYDESLDPLSIVPDIDVLLDRLEEKFN